MTKSNQTCAWISSKTLGKTFINSEAHFRWSYVTKLYLKMSFCSFVNLRRLDRVSVLAAKYWKIE